MENKKTKITNISIIKQCSGNVHKDSINKNVAIVGAGGQATIITEIFELLSINVVGYISTEPKGTIINGYPVLCSIGEYINNYKSYDVESLIISIGDNFIRKQIVSELEVISPNYINAIHPQSLVSSKAQLGKGILVNAGVIINPNTKIDDHSNIGTNSSIDHDCKVEKFANLAPSSTLCGGITVGSLSIIGPGATVIEKINIGENSLVAAGSVVISNIQSNVMVCGIPAMYKRDRQVGEKYLK